jgi:hypothetical protein
MTVVNPFEMHKARIALRDRVVAERFLRALYEISSSGNFAMEGIGKITGESQGSKTFFLIADQKTREMVARAREILGFRHSVINGDTYCEGAIVLPHVTLGFTEKDLNNKEDREPANFRPDPEDMDKFVQGPVSAPQRLSIVTFESGTGMIDAGERLTPIQAGREGLIKTITEAGTDIMQGMFASLFGGEECHDFIISAMPKGQGIDEIDAEAAVEGREAKVKGSVNRLIEKKNIGKKGQIRVSFSMGREAALDMIREIAGLAANDLKQTRVHCSMSGSVLEDINNDKSVLGMIEEITGRKYSSVRQFLSGAVMLDIINDSFTEDGIRNVFVLPYGRTALLGLSKLNLGHITETASQDREMRNDAIRSYAYSMALLSNNLSRVEEIIDGLIKQGDDSPESFFRTVFEIALPAVSKIDIEAIKESFDAESEALRSL